MNRRTFLQSSLAAGVAGAGFLPVFPYPEERSRPLADLRLNANENPLGLPDSARRAIVEGLGEANRYPFPIEAHLIEKLAQAHQVAHQNLVLGNGSSEVIQMVVQSLAGPGARVVVADPTFEIVAKYALAQSMEVEKVALRSDFSHNLEEMKKASGTPTGTALVYICNPNNPTASLTPCDQIEEWIRTSPDHIHFLIDEAYFDFVEDPGYRTFERMPLDNPNVVVIRTFSKVHGMAGMRLGYAIAHEETTGRLADFASRNNANQIVIAAAAASMSDKDFGRRSIESNRDGKKLFYEVMEHLDIEYIPSHTNFVMHRIRGYLETHQDRMREAGFLVGRAFPPMLDFNRVSIGTPAEMERFAQTVEDFRAKSWI